MNLVSILLASNLYSYDLSILQLLSPWFQSGVLIYSVSLLRKLTRHFRMISLNRIHLKVAVSHFASSTASSWILA